MSTFAFDRSLTPNTPENVADVQAMLDQLKNHLNGSIGAVNVDTTLLNKFLKLAVAADVKVAFGKIATPPAFAGGNQAGVNVTHGLGATPQLVLATAGYVAGIDNSSGVNQPVIAAVDSAGGTTFTLRLALANGATAAVGSGPVYWLAIA